MISENIQINVKISPPAGWEGEFLTPGPISPIPAKPPFFFYYGPELVPGLVVRLTIIKAKTRSAWDQDRLI